MVRNVTLNQSDPVLRVRGELWLTHGITLKCKFQLGADVMPLELGEFEHGEFHPCSEQLSCTKFRAAPAWDMWDMCSLPSSQPRLSKCFPVALQDCEERERTCWALLYRPHMLLSVLLHMNSPLMTWNVEFLEGPSFSAAGVCQQIWIFNQMESSSSKTCNLLQAGMHSCPGWDAHPWLPPRLSGRTKRARFESSEHFLFGLFPSFTCKVLNVLCLKPAGSWFSMKTGFHRMWKCWIHSPLLS